MLKIATIQIGNQAHGCVTDQRPNIRFSLKSDIQGESLASAELCCNGWRTETTDQLNNIYGGDMMPFTRYTVHITATGTSGEIAEGEATFETGRLDTPWQGRWITDESYTFPDKESPLPMVFRKSFLVKKPLLRAWVNTTALGVYELELNGQKVGTDYFAPGFTSYEHQIQYQTYDVTKALAADNQLKVTVAGGWAAGSFNHVRKSHISCDRQAFLGEVYLEYTDGSREIIATDESWQVTENSPFSLAEWYDGETYDATFDEGAANWRQADVTRPRGEPKLLAQYGAPVRAFETMHPVCQTIAPTGELVYDFGQNFAGVIHARIKQADKSQTIAFRHAEVLSGGELFVKSLRTAKATATYTCKEGAQAYSPRFTYMGFRYVGVSGIAAEDLELTALVLHTDFETIGEFSCSNPLLNRLHENIRWGGWSNFIDIPTDCPQRDERMGWTGDTAVFASTACYNFDMSRFYDKWLQDVSAEQGKGGGIPMVVPKQGDGWPTMATSCWGDCCVLVPWAEYLARGDKTLLERQYPTMKRFLKAAKWWAGFASLGPNSRYIWQFPFHWGDWCAPGETVNQWIGKAKWVGTAYFANSCGIAAQVAQLLGKQEDAEHFSQQREKIIHAYCKVFTDKKGRLKKEFQTAYVLPLHFNMTTGTETASMAANLNRLLQNNNYKLATGFPSTPYLLFALSDNGYLDTAYKVLLQEECPGWLYEVKAGGTTIWERWDALRPDGTVNVGDLMSKKADEQSDGGMVSFNHYANGAVGDWMYRRIAGIEPATGGYRSFRIAPVPGGGLTQAHGSIQTPFGLITSDWQIEGNRFTIQVKVPVSTACELRLPDGQKHTLASGDYVHTCTI